MKNTRLFALAIVACLATALAPAASKAQTGGNTINVPSEAEQLARGFAAAYDEIQRTPVFLVYERAGRTAVVSSVRSIRAIGGVLVVVNDKRLTYIVNARDVVCLTDDPPAQ
ncbi:hypothetical protein ASA1KI_20580 [Opitutales bacterium ASA1]|uniref:hypothetical protein n=1 Tax=Congregicoccus parvus TaxID=3081749 RepID=UPI002B2AB8EB|nr:hypothetical protein ASA1KI_20580 [Opitutales bacterium ASA1]